MPQQQFHTTADVFAVVKPKTDGSYSCPIKGCTKREHASAKDFGRHLAIKHHIPSGKHASRKAVRKTRKGINLPTLLVKHCPNCGFNIEEFEQAASLLLRTGK